MLARRNPHLVALKAVARSQRVALPMDGAIRGYCRALVGYCACGHITERRARLRLRQAHGSRVAARTFVECKHLFLQRGAVRHQQIRVAHRQQASADADRRGRKKTVGCGLHRVGQLHAADVIVLRGAEHARRRVRLVRIVRAPRQRHRLAIEVRLLGIDPAVERSVLLAGDALAGIQHGVEGVAGVVGKALPLTQRIYLQPLVQQKLNGGAQAHGL